MKSYRGVLAISTTSKPGVSMYSSVGILLHFATSYILIPKLGAGKLPSRTVCYLPCCHRSRYIDYAVFSVFEILISLIRRSLWSPVDPCPESKMSFILLLAIFFYR